jgi:hypothetical protein
VQMGGLPASSSPVPEPSTALLFAAGLAALSVRRRNTSHRGAQR